MNLWSNAVAFASINECVLFHNQLATRSITIVIIKTYATLKGPTRQGVCPSGRLGGGIEGVEGWVVRSLCRTTNNVPQGLLHIILYIAT